MSEDPNGQAEDTSAVDYGTIWTGQCEVPLCAADALEYAVPAGVRVWPSGRIVRFEATPYEGGFYYMGQAVLVMLSGKPGLELMLWASKRVSAKEIDAWRQSDEAPPYQKALVEAMRERWPLILGKT